MQRPQINNFVLPSAALSFMHSEEAGLLCVCVSLESSDACCFSPIENKLGTCD